MKAPWCKAMGCGGSRTDALEPRCLESWTKETESTWLTSTDELPLSSIQSIPSEADFTSEKSVSPGRNDVYLMLSFSSHGKMTSGSKESRRCAVGKCSPETDESGRLIHFLNLITRIWIIEWVRSGCIKTLTVLRDLAVMATDRDANECGLGILDAIVRRKITAELYFVLIRSSRTSSDSDLFRSLRCVHVLQISLSHTHPRTRIHIYVYKFIFSSICRFLRGQPSTSCSGLREGLFSHVWSQSERSKVQRPSCDHTLSSQGRSVTHSRHQSPAHKYPTHSRDCKIIWIVFLKTLTVLFFLLFIFLFYGHNW